MGFDKLFHRVFLSATATIAFSVIVAVGYLAKNENFGLATDSLTNTTTTCDWSTQYLKTSNNTCQPKTNCYDTANPEYNTTECQGVRSTNTSSYTTCPTGYYWNGTSCVASTTNTTTCSSGQTWNGTACVSNTTTVGQTTQIWNSFGLTSQIRTDADPTRISQLKQACVNVPNGANIWMPNAGVSTSVDFGMPDPAKCALAAACTSTQYFDGTSCVSSSGTSSNSSWVNKVWTFKDGTHSSYIFNRTDSEYLNYIASIEAQCLLINKSQFTWKPNAGDYSTDNWQNFGIPDCSASSSTSNTTSCPSDIMSLLGSGCHTMSSAYFDSAMTKYVLLGSSTVKYCTSNYISGCSTGSATTTCSSGQYWNGTACVDSTTTVGQITQTWNSLGLTSQIRTDADPARITQLKQACVKVPNGANIWMPNAGVSTSVDFGMPDPAKCALASACLSTQYFDGTSCVASSTTCPSGQSWSGTACVTNTTSCPTGQTWNGTSCVTTTTITYPFHFSGSGRTCNNYQECFDYCKTTPGSGTGDPATCDQYFPGATSYSTSASSCSSALVTLLGDGCHNMGNAYFNGAMDKYVLPGTTAAKACSIAPITNCTGQSPWTVPTEWKEIIWNSLGLRSYVSVNAPQTIIDAAKKACANTKPDQVVWPNPSDFSKPESAGIPDCSATSTAIVYPFVFSASGRVCKSYQECFDYCKTTPVSASGDVAICDKYFPGATTYKTIVQQSGQINGKVKDTSGNLLDDFFGFVYLETSGIQSGGAPVERGLFNMSVPAGTYRLVLEVPRTSSWTPTGSVSLTVEAGKTTDTTFTVKRNISEIWGFVTDASAKPIIGVPVKIFASGKNGVWQETSVDQKTGRYSFSVSAGSWFLKAAVIESIDTNTYFQQQAERSITLVDGERGQLDIVLLLSKSTIGGVVLNPRGEPFANAWVAVETRSYESSADTALPTALADFAAGARTDANGRFAVSVPPGTYYIHVFAADLDGLVSPPEQSVTLTAGEKRELTLTFRSTNTIIKGQVFAESKPIAAFISAWSERGGYVETNSKEDGSYALPVNNRDIWRLVASAKYQNALYRSSVVTVAASASSEIIQNLSVERERDLPAPVIATANANQPNVIAVEDGTRVSLPANSIAAAGRATVTITPDAELPQQGTAQVVGMGYEVKAFDESGQTVNKLNGTITVTIPYDPQELAKKGITPQDLKIAFWDETANVWRNLTASVVNKEEHTVTATVDHLTRFAIVAAADITPPEMPTAVTAKAQSTGGILLAWANPAKDFSHAKIYRSTKSAELGSVIKTDLAASSYNDTTAIRGSTYYYTVRAVDPAGNESININQVTAAATTSSPSSSTAVEPTASPSSSLTARLVGTILLQVEAKGEAWYVYPKNKQRYYLGRPADAFQIMRSLGLGITNANLEKIPKSDSKTNVVSSMAKSTSGTILLQVEAKGEAWYVYPKNKQRYYLGRPADAFAIMRSLGLGITNDNLNTVPIAANSPSAP